MHDLLRGDDAGKQVKGRQRHILVHTLGLMQAVVVTAASVPDRDGGKQRLSILRRRLSRWRYLWAEGAYAGPVANWVRALRPRWPIRVEITKRSDTAKSLVVTLKQWIIERTFGGYNGYRRLRKGDELSPETRVALIQVTMSHLMIRRLARIAPH
ncbi:MAG TPA: transposase [Candidatus Tectomicrobia bacterium]|nr:transposase [Candidatus Tectomicrobia bacterium]